MEIVKAFLDWPGPQRDVLRLFVDPVPAPWGATVLGEDVYLLRVLDAREQASGPVVGLEIDGFLEFDDWQAIPELPLRWQLPGAEPLASRELLRRKQRELRAEAKATSQRPAGAR